MRHHSSTTLGLVAAMAVSLFSGLASAQQPPAAAPRPAAPAPAAPPAAAPAAPAANPAAGAAAGAAASAPVMAAVQTPWVKICDKVPTDDKNPPTTKQLCMTLQETRAENGQFLASAQLRELEGDAKKQLIIAVPVGMLIQPGIRVVLDSGQPQNMRYELCLPNACFAQIEVNADMVARMKKANNLNIQVVTIGNRPITLAMSMSNFAKVSEGPGTDPKEYELQQKRLQDELQRRAEEARKRLESQPGGAPGAAPAAPGAAPAAPRP